MIDEGIWAAYKVAHNAVDSLAQRLRRMDDWIAELMAHQPSGDGPSSEWSRLPRKAVQPLESLIWRSATARVWIRGVGIAHHRMRSRV